MENFNANWLPRIFSYKNVLFVFIIAFLFSCETDTNEPTIRKPEEKVYLVDYKKQSTKYKKKYIKTIAMGLRIYTGVPIPFIDKIVNDIQIYTIKYNTTFEGKNVIASGLVLMPKKAKKFPLLSFQNGTNTEHRKAPSVYYESIMFQLFNIIASTGFIVSVPDYLGFGASENMYHPYLDKESTVSSVVDMLKAVKELTNEKKISTKSTKDVYIAGYSQGGWATMCVQKALEQDNGKNFHLVASSCGAGPYNLETVIEYVLKRNRYNNPYFLAYVFNTMLKKGVIDQEILDKIIRPPYNKKIQDNLFNGINSGGDINSQLSREVAEMFTDDFIKNYKTSPDFKVIKDFFHKNSVGFWKTDVPTKLFHGNTDIDIPFTTSQEAYDEMVALGTNKSTLELIEIPNKTHGQAILPAEIKTIDWFLKLKE